jgi:endonuclease/exonuclease/phosphatase (EEP) superfamily protein YafD
LPVWLILVAIGLTGTLVIPERHIPVWFWIGTLGAIGLGTLNLRAVPQPMFASTNDLPEIRLKIITFNLWKENRNPALAARWIRNQKPDIVVLTEAASHAVGVPAMLSDVLPFRQTCRTGGRCSTLILSRIQPNRSVGLGTGDIENRKGLSAALMGWSESFGGATVLGVHLARPYPVGAVGGIGDLRREIIGLNRDRLILAGDFNLTRSTFAMRQLLQEANLTEFPHTATTWPTGALGQVAFPLFDFDHIFVGCGWRIRSFERGPDLGSDHFPIVVTISTYVRNSPQVPDVKSRNEPCEN